MANNFAATVAKARWSLVLSLLLLLSVVGQVASWIRYNNATVSMGGEALDLQWLKVAVGIAIPIGHFLILGLVFFGAVKLMGSRVTIRHAYAAFLTVLITSVVLSVLGTLGQSAMALAAETLSDNAVALVLAAGYVFLATSPHPALVILLLCVVCAAVVCDLSWPRAILVAIFMAAVSFGLKVLPYSGFAAPPAGLVRMGYSQILRFW